MSTYREHQEKRYDVLVENTVRALRDLADRVEREAKRHETSKYSTRVHGASSVVHEIHVALMNLPLSNLIEVAHEATPRTEEGS